MDERSYTHIVIGAGALGAAAAYWLARAGSPDVLVLEQYRLGHDLGASEDRSRIIRHAYHSPAYTALTPAAYESWRDLEAETGARLVSQTGGLDLAREGSLGARELDDQRHALASAGLQWDDLSADEIRRRWSQWHLDDDIVGMYQDATGILDVGRATAAHIALARSLGVTFLPETPVSSIASTDRQVTVRTGAAEFAAESLVLCMGSWLPELLPDLGLNWPIMLSQEQTTYFAPSNVRDLSPDRFPVWVWHGQEDVFYGFPADADGAVKAGRDMGGRFITPQTRSHDPDPAEAELTAAFLREHVAGAAGPVIGANTCVYEMPPDREFIVDLVPGHPRIAVACGAGHAAKFARLLGRVLADLALDGRTDYPIGAFAVDRPALTDPTFTPTLRFAAENTGPAPTS